MNLWTIKEIYKALELKQEIKKKIKFTGVSIDSRTIKKGNLYIPIKGKNYDGHDYIKEAFQKGAYASLIEIKKKKSFKNNGALIYVKDSLASLTKLSKFSRNRINNLKTICITGSSGKTTLKEWIYKIFKDLIKSYSTIGNLNNEIGMPLTLVNMPKSTELCILELGMNSPGEIKKLSGISKPDIAIITNIGSAHAGNFRKKSSIAEEKSEIFNFFNKNSIAIIPFDSAYYNLIYLKASKKTEKIYSFGYNKNCEIRIFKNQNHRLWKFFIINEEIEINKDVPFSNWASNICIILGLAKILGIKITKIIPKLKNLSPISGRGKVTKINFKKKKITLIDESYNSNPESLNQAIENLNDNKFSGSRKICIIGDMLELGKMSKVKHIRIVKPLLKIRPDIVITVGSYSKAIYENLPESFFKLHFDDYRNVFKKLLRMIKNKDIIMIKGSNSLNLHMISEKLIMLG